MARTVALAVCALAALALAACDRPPKPVAQDAPKPARVATPFDDALKARDRAKQVQQQVDQQKAQTDAAVDQQSQ